MYALAGLRPGVFSARNDPLFAPQAVWTGGLLKQFPGKIRTQATIDQVASVR
jgi:hypothetical protein